jgi:hypothetical protein
MSPASYQPKICGLPIPLHPKRKNTTDASSSASFTSVQSLKVTRVANHKNYKGVKAACNVPFELVEDILLLLHPRDLVIAGPYLPAFWRNVLETSRPLFRDFERRLFNCQFDGGYWSLNLEYCYRQPTGRVHWWTNGGAIFVSPLGDGSLRVIDTNKTTRKGKEMVYYDF